METAALSVSHNRRQGSLRDAPIEAVLETCLSHRFTGKIDVWSGEQKGELELNVGVVDVVRFGALSGDRALSALRALREGEYALSQRLPDLDGTLGESAVFESIDGKLSLVAIMSHCERNAMTCVVVVVQGFDRGEIHYRLGDIVDVTLNGKSDEDAIVHLVKLEQARFRVEAKPLEPGLHGWPATSPDESRPFLPRTARPRKTKASARQPIRAVLAGILLGVAVIAAGRALALEMPNVAERIEGWLAPIAIYLE